MALTVPPRVAANCGKTPGRTAWLKRLPQTLSLVQRQWRLTTGGPFRGVDVSCAWVGPAELADGTRAVLKLCMPHMEAEHEGPGLRFWDGDPTVRLLREDEEHGALLLERCQPGTPLRSIPESQQDRVIAELLRRLWRLPAEPHPFRPLSMMLDYWSRETLANIRKWPDVGMVLCGLKLFEELPRTAPRQALLATDLHAGNVLQSEREPWLAIDPKPFVGDPAYDATQHLLNCQERLQADPDGTIGRMADLLDLDPERLRLWTFARAAAEPRDDWNNERLLAIAGATAP